MKKIERRMLAFRVAGNGILYLVKHELHFQIHIFVSAIVSLAGWYFGLNRWEWVSIVLCIGFVWTAEAFNTAVERWTDLATQEELPLAGLVKDLAAAAVLLSVIMAGIVGCIVFIPVLF